MLVILTIIDEYCFRVLMSTLKLSEAKREEKKYIAFFSHTLVNKTKISI
jgi:hypothetical protein